MSHTVAPAPEAVGEQASDSAGIDTARTDSVQPDPARYEGTAVNPRTFLATDYLNHFNEAIMLLEMVSAMPECLEDLRAWSPKSYVQHFHDSVFKDRKLCIEAYAFVEAGVRGRLEEVTSQLDIGVADAIERLGAAVEADDADYTEWLCLQQSTALRAQIDKASGIINGVDEIHAGSLDMAATDHIDATQAAVDALFD